MVKKKKNMRVIDISKFSYESKTTGKFFDNSFLLQEKDNLLFQKKMLKCVTKNKPSSRELKDIEFAFRICKYYMGSYIRLYSGSNNVYADRKSSDEYFPKRGL